MRRRIAIHGLSEETVELLPLLEANPEVEIALLFDPEPGAARARLRALDPRSAAALEPRLTDDVERLRRDETLYAVIDAGGGTPFAARCPEARHRGVQILSPLTARLLLGYGVSARNRKQELLRALHEVVESVDLAVDADELFERMLEIAIGATGAERGSLMLLDPERRELRIRVAVGVEPELWPKIRVPLGEGIAGRVAADARPLRLRGRADRQAFQIVRERGEIESAICVPLLHEGSVLGVLNLHHTGRPDAFSEEDLHFAEQLAALDARIIARAQEHAALREQAARYTIDRHVRQILARPVSLTERLHALCRFVASRMGGGIATLYLHEDGELRVVASSLAGGGFGSDYRARPGEGLDGGAARERRPLVLYGAGGAPAYAALPLLAGDALVGVLSVQAGAEPLEPGLGEPALIEIAAAAADCVAQSEREARIAARATKAGAINETGLRLISTTDVNEVVRLAASSGAMILEADHAVLRLRDEATGRYAIRAYYGSADGRLQEKLFRLDRRVSVDTLKRRAQLHVRDAGSDPELAAFGTGVRSLIASPLRQDGRVIGTFAIYDKIAPDTFLPGVFGDEDADVFRRFASYVERAVANAKLHARVQQQPGVDEETDLPDGAWLRRRLDEEIARAVGRGSSLALAVCRIENLDDIAREAGQRHATRIVQRTARALRDHVRGFDLVARTAPAELAVLLPDPAAPAEDSVSALARAVVDDVAKDDALNTPVRVALGFGFALCPQDAGDRDSLQRRAAQLRIRTV